MKSVPRGCSRNFEEGICLVAFGSVYRQIMTLRYGGISPFGNDPDVMLTNCPDPNRCVVYELRRITG